MKKKKRFIPILAAVIIIIAALATIRTYIVRSGVQLQNIGTFIGNYTKCLDITVDFDDEIGDIKPVNGINNGPVSKAVIDNNGKVSFEFDVTDYYKAMNIPCVRLHDSEYPFGSDKFIDIHCIFPDFNADADDPASYYFDASDAYITKIVEAGEDVMYRLGESIDHTGENKYINPPADYDKWASICEHIVRHYNEGWNNGFHYGIKYWEIWNEPDNTMMWTGTQEEYYRLYAVTAKLLKSTYKDDILVGGPGFTGVKEDDLRAFLDYIKNDSDIPLDFLSWHDYNYIPSKFVTHAQTARNILDEYGYTDTLSVLNEWNYVEDWNDQTSSIEARNTLKGGAFTAIALMAMQYSGVDLANFYDGQYMFADYYCTLYGRDRQLKPGYYAFKYWGELRKLGTQVRADFNIDDNVIVAAATSKSGLRGIMIVNYNLESRKIKLNVNDDDFMESVNLHRVYTNKGEKLKSKMMMSGSLSIRLKPGEIMYIEL